MNSIENVAKHGKDRLFPSIFDRVWEGRFGNSPVARAIEVTDRWEREAQENKARPRAVIGAIAVFAVSIFGGHTMAQSAWNGWPGWVIMVTAVVAVVAAVVFSERDYSLAYEDSVERYIPDHERASIDLFWQAYSKFVEWSGQGAIQIAGLSEARLKEIATAILVQVAVNKVRLEAETNADKVLELTGELGALADDFKTKYQILEMLNLVTGGHGKFYAEAEKIAKQAKAA